MGYQNVPPPLPALLTSCPDCQREISRKATHCVHCGRPWPVRHPLKKVLWTGIVMILALGAGSFAALKMAEPNPFSKLKKGEAGAYTDASNRPEAPKASPAGSEHH